MKAVPALPEGLTYQSDFLSAGEEATLAVEIARQALQPFEFHGFLGKRRTVSFGWRYRFDGSGLAPADAFPAFLLPIRDRAARLAGLDPEALGHAMLIEYAPGAGIGWHRDRPVFGDVIGVSLLAPARLRFRIREGVSWRRTALIAEPRSAYLLTGPARHAWEHSIPPMDALRYSITFRSFAPGRGPAG